MSSAHETRLTWLRRGLFVLWILCIVGVYLLFRTQHIPMRLVPTWIRFEALNAGAWGPFVLLCAYQVVTVIPFPTAALAIVSGSIYGPWMGGLIAIIGLNLASALSFYFGRFFGRHFITTHEHGWLRRYDEAMSKNGFMAVFVMRLLFLPFDYVSLGCGMTRMSFRQYMLGTICGSFPQTLTFVILGEALHKPKSWILFAVLLLVSLACVMLLRRSAWVKAHVFESARPMILE